MEDSDSLADLTKAALSEAEKAEYLSQRIPESISPFVTIYWNPGVEEGPETCADAFQTAFERIQKVPMTWRQFIVAIVDDSTGGWYENSPCGVRVFKPIEG